MDWGRVELRRIDSVERRRNPSVNTPQKDVGLVWSTSFSYDNLVLDGGR